MTENEIRKVIVIDAPSNVVFKAISDPAQLTEWFPDAAVLEPEVGGRFVFAFYKSSDRYGKKMIETQSLKAESLNLFQIENLLIHGSTKMFQISLRL